jgi:hypothetical protein
MIRKTIVATIAASTLSLGAMGAAYAASTTVTTTGAKATVSFKSGAWGDINGGTLYDTNGGDSKCARIYERGYNVVLQWTDWHLKATVCGGGSTQIPAVHYSAFSDHVEVTVCAGFDTCKVSRLW